jgi:uncharacterized protein YqhQ
LQIKNKKINKKFAEGILNIAVIGLVYAIIAKSFVVLLSVGMIPCNINNFLDNRYESYMHICTLIEFIYQVRYIKNVKEPVVFGWFR